MFTEGSKTVNSKYNFFDKDSMMMILCVSTLGLTTLQMLWNSTVRGTVEVKMEVKN